jgi:hypothetical protein
VAAGKGHGEVVELLVQAGANVNAAEPKLCTALHTAALHGEWGVVEQLLAAGADTEALTVDGETALALAAEKGHRDVVQLLLSCEGSVGSVGHLLKAGHKAKGDMAVWALLAGEVASRFPEAAGELIGDVGLMLGAALRP